jgi:transposase-like protein
MYDCIALFLLYNCIKIGGFKLSERKTVKHRQYSIEEKNEIVEMYLSGQTKGQHALAKDIDKDTKDIRLWIKQYLEFGTTVDRRGKSSKKDNPNIGRPKKPMKLEDMSKEQLIEHVRMIEDIKKVAAYLKTQKKNTK